MRRGKVVLERHSDDEFPQVSRVLRVLSRVDGATLRRIGAAEDHKGTLSVWWVEKPDAGDMARVEHEWQAENEMFLEYVFPDERVMVVETGTTVREFRGDGA